MASERRRGSGAQEGEFVGPELDSWISFLRVIWNIGPDSVRRLGLFHTSSALQSNTRFPGHWLAWHFARLHSSRVMCGVKIELTATDAHEMELPQKFHSSR